MKFNVWGYLGVSFYMIFNGNSDDLKSREININNRIVDGLEAYPYNIYDVWWSLKKA